MQMKQNFEEAQGWVEYEIMEAIDRNCVGEGCFFFYRELTRVPPVIFQKQSQFCQPAVNDK